jgi:hypothetical protein
MKVWKVVLLQMAFLALVILVVVRVVWPWIAAILRANGVKGV